MLNLKIYNRFFLFFFYYLHLKNIQWENSFQDANNTVIFDERNSRNGNNLLNRAQYISFSNFNSLIWQTWLPCSATDVRFTLGSLLKVDHNQIIFPMIFRLREKKLLWCHGHLSLWQLEKGWLLKILYTMQNDKQSKKRTLNECWMLKTKMEFLSVFFNKTKIANFWWTNADVNKRCVPQDLYLFGSSLGKYT